MDSPAEAPPDRVRPLVFGSLVAGAAGVLWGVAAIFTGRFHDLVAPGVGLAVGGTLALTGRRLRGPGLQALAVALTGAAWLAAFYLTYFGEYLTEVSEHQGHRAADAVPVTLIFTRKFLAEFVGALPASVHTARLAWLVSALVLAALATRRGRPS